ncbi:hypothetical protein [Helicobacter pylori]|uniref:hypothetical protein n=1 Tax=Helicobacter pylori TaxID=210 RepID=UPI001E3C0C3E|nr:hypothetical protein [Helicobacter pylori]
MLFKTYQKLLGASYLALYLMGCGSGGGAESPVEIRVSNNGDFQIRSKADSVTIQGVKFNRSNCVVRFGFFSSEYPFEIEDASNQELVSMQDLKDIIRNNEKIIEYEKTNYGSGFDFLREEKRLANIKDRLSQLKRKGVMMEPQTLKFGENLSGRSRECDIIEAEIQTDKGTRTFNFNR